MKKVFLAAGVAALFFTACNQTKTSSNTADSTAAVQTADSAKVQAPDAANAPVMKFENTTYDFGEIKQGDNVTYDFKFTNTGKSPLIISNAQASCGCTVPSYPHEPIAPGKEGVIKVIFNSDGKMGKQNKAVTIVSNAVPSTNVVYLNGEVKEPKTN